MPSLRRALSVSGLCLLALPDLVTARVGRTNNNNGNGGNTNTNKGNGPPAWSGASAGAAGLKPLAGGTGTESILIEVIAIGSTAEEAKANAERGVRAHGAKIIPPGQLKTIQQEEAAAYTIDFNGINIFQDKNVRNNPTFEYYELAGADYLDEMSAAMNLWNGVEGSVFQGTVRKVGTGLTTYPEYSPADGATYRASACSAAAVSDLDAAFTMGWADMGVGYEGILGYACRWVQQGGRKRDRYADVDAVFNVNPGNGWIHVEHGVDVGVFNVNPGNGWTWDGGKVCTTAAHEIGHLVGMGHSDVAGALMFPEYQGNVCPGYSSDASGLAQDDKNALTALYPGETDGTGGGDDSTGGGGGGGDTCIASGSTPPTSCSDCCTKACFTKGKKSGRCK